MPKSLFLACISFSVLSPLWAGTVIESRDLEGNINTITIEGKQIRQEINESEYRLIDLQNDKFYTVVPNQNRIIDMSTFYAKPAEKKDAGDRVVLQFEKLGKGPRIATYKTTQYKMMINDFVCADVFLSLQAYEVEDLKTLVKAVTLISGREAAMGVSGDGDPCERAEFELTEEQFRTLGIPMKTVSRDGHTDHEILKIKTNTMISTKIFNLPKSYNTLSVEELYKLME